MFSNQIVLILVVFKISYNAALIRKEKGDDYTNRKVCTNKRKCKCKNDKPTFYEQGDERKCIEVQRDAGTYPMVAILL